MKLTIQDFCIRCGICITLYPELYEMDFIEDQVRTKNNEIPPTLMDEAKQSIKDCAVTAIHLKKQFIFFYSITFLIDTTQSEDYLETEGDR